MQHLGPVSGESLYGLAPLGVLCAQQAHALGVRTAAVVLEIPFVGEHMGEEVLHALVVVEVLAVVVALVPVYEHAAEVEYYCHGVGVVV